MQGWIKQIHFELWPPSSLAMIQERQLGERLAQHGERSHHKVSILRDFLNPIETGRQRLLKTQRPSRCREIKQDRGPAPRDETSRDQTKRDDAAHHPAPHAQGEE